MQLYFICHAQSANNALYSSTGSWVGRSEDPGLTDTGIQQADRLADFLLSGNPDGGFSSPSQPGDGFGFTHLYTSLMLRAVCTATVAAVDRLCRPA